MILTAHSLFPIIHRLNSLFRAQFNEVRIRLPGAIRTGRALDLSHWNDTFYTVMLPLMRPQWQAGLAQGRAQMRNLEMPSHNRFSPKQFGVKSANLPVSMVRKDVNWLRDTSFYLHNPNVAQAISDATMTFCRATNETATTDLNTAIARLRGELAEGIEMGEAFTDLGKRVQTLFSDPSRAYLIAETETSRALNGGSVLTYQREGLEMSEWLTTSDPCPEICEPLNGEQRRFGEPFVVLTKGNPAYRQVMFPPAHPHCFCTVVPVIA